MILLFCPRLLGDCDLDDWPENRGGEAKHKAGNINERNAFCDHQDNVVRYSQKDADSNEQDGVDVLGEPPEDGAQDGCG